MDNPPVLYEIQDNIGTITLNRPQNRNSMDAELLPAFARIIDQVKSDKTLRCLVITGTGKSFCAGADFHSSLTDTEGLMPQEIFMRLYESFLLVGDLEIPTIAAMNGHAIGGGFGLALMCDIRVANQDSKYGANFARLGIHSGMAISYVLPRLVGLPRALELLFTGRLIKGQQAAEIGVANYALTGDAVLQKARELAEEIALSAPVAVRMMKASTLRGLDWNPRQAALYESHCQSRTFEMNDAREGISALLEKRKPNFTGT